MSAARRVSRLRLVAALSALLLVALVALGALATRRAEAAVREALAAVSTRLGRPVTARAVTVRLLPSPEVTVADVTVGPARGAQGEARRPLLTLGAARVRLALVPLVRSRGADVRVTSVELRAPVLTAVLLPGGTSSLDDLRRHPSAPRAPSSLRALRVARVTVTDGAAHLVDASDGAPATASVTRVEATLTGLSPDGDATLRATAALLGDVRNARLTASLGRLRVVDGAPTAPRVARVGVAFDEVELGPALRVAAKHRAMRLLGGVARGEVELTPGAGTTPTRLRGALRARAVVLRRRDGTVHPPVEAGAELDVALDASRDEVDVRRFEVTLDGMALGGSARVARAGGAPVVHALEVASRTVTLERLDAWLPARVVPRGARLAGPLRFTARGRTGADGAAAVRVELDLGDATLELPERLHKPAGTALSAAFEGRVRGRDVTVERLGVTLGPLRAHLRGEVRGARAFDLTFDTGEVPVDPLLRLLPAVRARVPEAVTLHGRVQASGSLRTRGDAHLARATVAVRGADVRAGDLTVAGDGDLTLSGADGARGLEVDLRLDATAARVELPGRVAKAAGATLVVGVRVERRGGRTSLPAVSVQLPGAYARAAGRWDDAARRAEVTVGLCTFDLARLLPSLPLAASRVPRGLATSSGSFALDAQGAPDAPDAAHVAVRDLTLRTPTGTLRGGLDVTGLDAPRRVRFDLWGDVLDLAALLGPRGGDAPATPPWVAGVDLEGSLRFDVLRAPTVTLAAPRASVQLREGRLAFPTLTFGALGGTFQLDGSAVTLGAPTRRVEAVVRAARVDLFLVGAMQGTELARRTTGSLDVDAHLVGEGVDEASLRASLRGPLRLSGINLVPRRVMQPTLRFDVPLLGARTRPTRPRDPTRPLTVHRFDAPLRLEAGAVRTTAPVTAETDMGEVRLEGRVAADGALALAGRVTLTPEAVERATGGSRIPGGPVPVGIRVTGTADAPQVELDDLATTLGALVGSRLRAIGRGIFQ